MVVPEVIETLLANPVTTLVGGLSLSALLIIFDFETGYSLDIPGGNRLGAAGLVALGSALIFWYSRNGLIGLASEIASGIIGAIIVTGAVAFYLRN